MTTPLSPAAQAVWTAAWEDCPIQCGDIVGTRRKQIAAALRAAADQVIPTTTDVRLSMARYSLLAIAAELEARPEGVEGQPVSQPYKLPQPVPEGVEGQTPDEYNRRFADAAQVAGVGDYYWNERFLSALRNRGLALSVLRPANDHKNQYPKGAPMLAPHPYPGGAFAWPLDCLVVWSHPVPEVPTMPAAINDMPEAQRRWYALGWRAAIASMAAPFQLESGEQPVSQPYTLVPPADGLSALNPASLQRRVLLVLGMHRSGTSAITGLLHLLNDQGEFDFIAPCDDNPTGYWEIKAIVNFNSRLLVSAGTAWNDLQPIAPAWFLSPEREQDKQLALEILEKEFGPRWQSPDEGFLILKDPRISRLLPFWLPLLRSAGLQVSAIMALRSPLEVAMSLKARQSDEKSRPRSIASISVAVLLWLRYNLDCVLDSLLLDLDPVILDYCNLHDYPNGMLRFLFEEASLPLELLTPELERQVDLFVRPELHRQRFDDFPFKLDCELSTVAHIFGLLMNAKSVAALRSGLPELRELASLLDLLCSIHQPLPSCLDLTADDDSWTVPIFHGLHKLRATWKRR